MSYWWAILEVRRLGGNGISGVDGVDLVGLWAAGCQDRVLPASRERRLPRL